MFETKSSAIEAEHVLSDHETASEIAALQATLSSVGAPPVAAPNPGYQFPARLKLAMVACYAIFFALILSATGGSAMARFVIAISALYAVMFFGLARLCGNLPGPEERSPLDSGRMLQTWTGPLDSKSVFGQVLVVPIGMVIFGVAIAAIIGAAM